MAAQRGEDAYVTVSEPMSQARYREADPDVRLVWLPEPSWSSSLTINLRLPAPFLRLRLVPASHANAANHRASIAAAQRQLPSRCVPSINFAIGTQLKSTHHLPSLSDRSPRARPLSPRCRHNQKTGSLGHSRLRLRRGHYTAKGTSPSSVPGAFRKNIC